MTQARSARASEDAPVSEEERRWAEAHALFEQYGAGSLAHIGASIDAMVLKDDSDGVVRMLKLADFVLDLMGRHSLN